MKKTLCWVILAGGIVMSGALAYAQEQSSHHKMMQMPMDEQKQAADTNTSQEAVNVGNKVCPVTGEKIDEKTKATYEYKGKIYNFCCPMCIDEFKKDPGKYIKKIEEELQAQPQEKTEKHEMGTMGEGSSKE